MFKNFKKIIPSYLLFFSLSIINMNASIPKSDNANEGSSDEDSAENSESKKNPDLKSIYRIFLNELKEICKGEEMKLLSRSLIPYDIVAALPKTKQLINNLCNKYHEEAKEAKANIKSNNSVSPSAKLPMNKRPGWCGGKNSIPPKFRKANSNHPLPESQDKKRKDLSIGKNSLPPQPNRPKAINDNKKGGGISATKRNTLSSRQTENEETE